MLKCMFNIPPFHNKKELIEVLTLYVNLILDKSNDIVIPDSDSRLIEYYIITGYQMQRTEKLMVCVTREGGVIEVICYIISGLDWINKNAKLCKSSNAGIHIIENVLAGK